MEFQGYTLISENTKESNDVREDQDDMEVTSPDGVAWQKGIQIGAGVIDNDFRGEVKILIFNMTYGNIVLNKREAITQLILEKIATPEVVQMVELPQIVRGAGDFGSTTEQDMNRRSRVTHPSDTLQVQIGTLEWENLMNKLVPLNSTPSTSQRQLHALTTEEPNKWINPFYTEGGGYDSSNSSFYSAESDDNAQMIAHIDLEEGLELAYPIQKQSEGIFASSYAISRYNPPEDTMMGPPQYAPATEQPSTQNPYQNPGFIGVKIGKIKREYS
ncbi:hypothetical protein ZIOFF_043762 [Zingiber officinale]|uniref:dUTP diphosphatase n=1 Tax=Zingiber officinale TaxID=94328 RepID=A0A8J5G0Z1_ZINOF|nr:hypothetical protein ZIOFF_043762 [Zingiber officinale]